MQCIIDYTISEPIKSISITSTIIHRVAAVSWHRSYLSDIEALNTVLSLSFCSSTGHTVGCISLVLHAAGMIFTGDALFIRGCGRTDFQGGSAERLYDSVHQQIFSLPPHYFVLPAHNYGGQWVSTVGEEMQFNPRCVLFRSFTSSEERHVRAEFMFQYVNV